MRAVAEVSGSDELSAPDMAGDALASRGTTRRVTRVPRTRIAASQF